MVADDSAWGPSGPTSLESRFLVDDGTWHDAPMLTGQSSFQPLPDVKNILVTGGEGFIGSWVVRHLSIKYQGHYNIVSFDKLDYCSSLNNARMLQSRKLGNFSFFHGDVTIPGDVIKCLQKHNIDTVFHLAAHTHVDLSFGNSYNFTKNNVFGTHVLLECIKKYGKVQRFYHISTDEVYDEALAADMAETSMLKPTNPYSASKAAAEMIVNGYVKSHGLPAVMIRLNNVMGPHQYPEKVIPKFINLLRRGKPLLLHGDGQHTRRYLYAGDAAEAFDTILHKGEIGETYNVDSKDEISNLQLAEKLIGLFGMTDSGNWIQYTRDRKFNDRRYAVDGSKLEKLGWKQRTSFDAALQVTVDWYGKFAGWFGDIEGVLTAHPVVKGDHVVQPVGNSQLGVGQETKIDHSAKKLDAADAFAKRDIFGVYAAKLQQSGGQDTNDDAFDRFTKELDAAYALARKEVSATYAAKLQQVDGQETKAGALHSCVKDRDAPGKSKAVPAANIGSNGGSQNGNKKRKADKISYE